MSLYKQLYLGICLFLLVAFTGSFIAGVEASREQLRSQLQVHAQDTANALALSLTAQVDDPAMRELLVSAIFDSGYFTGIRVLRIADDQVLVERSGAPILKTVPQWFAALVDLSPQAGEALVMRGWQQIARVDVLSHPQFALAKLWDSALASLLWLLLCGLLSALLGGWLLHRQLRPLDDLQRQAQAISRREFLSLAPLPRTPELRRVVLAMNQMAAKLKALFDEQAARSEQLREAAYQDELTGLANRRLFDIQLAKQLVVTEQHAAGYLLLVQVNDLQGLNQRLGSQPADALLQAIGDLLKRLLAEHGQHDWLAAHTHGGEFSLLAPGLNGVHADQLAEELLAGLEPLRQTGASDCRAVAHLGLGAFRPGESAEAVLARANQALLLAQQQPSQSWVRLDDFNAPPNQDLRHWRAWLDEALQQDRLQLYFQPVLRCDERRQVLHYKVLARLLGPQGEAVATSCFLPWIERLGWAARFDLAMLEHSLAHLAEHPQPLALSLCAATLHEPHSRARLLGLLRQHRQQAGLLTLEVDERYRLAPAELQHFSQQLRRAGCHLGLQHFGGRFSLLGNLSLLGLAYLKIDGSYIRGIDRESDKRLFIEALFRATHNIDLPLLAEMVETPEELAQLTEIGIHGAMGSLIGPPQPWPP